ncbi:MAG: LysR substrate-binding domain-containing protein, partial [Pseudomonadota bacterium]
AEGFGKISSGIQQLTEAESARPLHITMTPSFAIGWLMPRLPLFREAHPEVELMVNPTVNVVSLADAGYDLAIRFGRGPWPGLESVPLISTNFTIVAAPKLLEGRDISSPGDLLDLPWLQEYGTQEVVDWLATRGVVLPKMARVTDLPGYMLLPALRDGQGVGAAARMFLDGDIEDGRLVALFEESDEKSPTAYHLVWRPGIQRPALKAFIRWIRRAA